MTGPKNNESRSPLLALTSAALALPAYSATQPAETELSIKTSTYGEENVPRHRVVLGSDERYDIDIHQFSVVAPVGRDWSLAFNAAQENMSGASPWGTLAGADGEPVLIMSGATISESRTEVSVGVNRYLDNFSFGLAVNSSRENDYEADAIVVSGEWDFNNRLSTLALGLSYSDDEITPTDAMLFGRVEKEDKQSRSLNLSFTQVLNKTSVVQFGISLTRDTGYLTDPYKLRDVRPDKRLERTTSLRYRKYFEPVNGAWHINYRFYDDDFGVQSHTLKTAWYQNLGDRFQIVPNLRYYSQSEADFYLAVDDYTLPLSVDQSSDYRLSTFGAYTFGLQGIARLDNWSVSVTLDRYISDEKYSLSDSPFAHPALLDFTLASLGFSVKF